MQMSSHDGGASPGVSSLSLQSSTAGAYSSGGRRSARSAGSWARPMPADAPDMQHLSPPYAPVTVTSAAMNAVPALPAALAGTGLPSPPAGVSPASPALLPSTLAPRYSPYLSVHGDRSQQPSLQPSTLSMALLQQQQQLHGHTYARGETNPDEREQLIDHRHQGSAQPSSESDDQSPAHAAATAQSRYFFSPALAAVSSAASSLSSAILPQHSTLPLSSTAEQPLSSLGSARNTGGVKRVPDIAGAHKKDDSLHVRDSDLTGGLQLQAGPPNGIDISGSASKARGERNLYRHSFNKLTVESQSMLVRVKRAMSTSAGGGGGGSGGALYSSSSSASWSVASVKQSLVRRWKDLPLGVREKVLFAVSSILGSGFFFLLFESFFRLLSYNLDLDPGTTFTVSYTVAYLVSILYQHMLNRLLVFQTAPYCSSLCHTYAVYSISLVLLTALGAALISALHAPPRVVACVTLPVSGFANFYLLRACLEPTVDVGNPTAQQAALHRQELARLRHGTKHQAEGIGHGAGTDTAGGSGSGTLPSSSSLAAMESGGGGGGVALSPVAVTLLPLQSPVLASSSPSTPNEAPLGTAPAAHFHAGMSAGGGGTSGAPPHAAAVGLQGNSSGSAGAASSITAAPTASPFGNRRFAVTATAKKPNSTWQHYSAALYSAQDPAPSS